MMNQDELAELRALAQRFAERVRLDSDFRAMVQANPDLLMEEGLPEMAMADFLRSTDLLDVSGYLGCSSISSI